MLRLTLLTRSYCHLCDEMAAALAPRAAAARVEVTVVDVDARADLESRWGDAVPVLFAGDPDPAREVCRHRLDPDRLRATLAKAGIAEPVATGREIR